MYFYICTQAQNELAKSCIINVLIFGDLHEPTTKVKTAVLLYLSYVDLLFPSH